VVVPVNSSALKEAPTTPSPRFAWRPVGAVVVIAAAVFVGRAGRYRFFGDELYLLSAGRRPEVSYADQGPLVPLQAHLADLLAPGSEFALRVPAALLAAVGGLLAAAIAREFGAGRAPQTCAAVAAVGTPFAVSQASALSTYSWDAALTALLTWLFVRWTRTRRDRLLLAAALVAALDWQVKWLAPMVCLALAVGVTVWGPRSMLRRPALWVGGGLVLASAVPAVLWQWRHGWPQWHMGAVIHAEQTSANGGVVMVPLELVALAGPIGVLLLIGIWAAIRWDRLRPYRFLLAGAAAMVALAVLDAMRPYFTGWFPLYFAAGAAFLWRRGALGRRVAAFGTAVVVFSGVLVVALVAVLPLPARSAGTRPQMFMPSLFFDTNDWPRLVDGVRRGYQLLPAGDRAAAAIVTQNYWQAGAVEEFWRTGRPAVYSPNRGFGYFGAPPDSTRVVLYVGNRSVEPTLRAEFGEVAALVAIDDPRGVPGLDRGVVVWRCAAPRRPWSVAWPSMSTLLRADGTWGQ
jgi:hypothetical protein